MPNDYKFLEQNQHWSNFIMWIIIIISKQNVLIFQIFKGIVSDSNNIFLWQNFEDINEKKLFPKFQLIPIFCYKLCMIMCINIAP